MPPIVIAIAISMKDVLVSFGPPFALAMAAMVLFALAFPPPITSAALAGGRMGLRAAVAGMLGLGPANSAGSSVGRVAAIAELAASLPAIVLAATLAPGVAALRLVVGLLFASMLGRSVISDSSPIAAHQDAQAATNPWNRLIGTASRFLDRYLNSIILAAVAAGVIGFLVPDEVVARVLGGSLLYAPVAGVLVGVVTPAKGGAEVIVAATLLAKGAGVPATMALLLSAPLLNAWTFRQLTAALSRRRAVVVWSAIAVPAALLGPAAALLPGLQRI